MAAEAHSHEHMHDAEHDHLHGDVPVAEVRRSYAPARLVCLGMGGFFGTVGIIALSRTGIDFNSVREPTTTILNMGMTPLLAMIFVGVALVSLLVAGIGPLTRLWLALAGAVMLAAGVVVLWRPAMLDEWLAHTRTNGVAYLVAGGAALAAVIGTPITWTRRSRAARRDMIAA